MLKVSLGMSVREFTIVVREHVGGRMKSKLVMVFCGDVNPVQPFVDGLEREFK